MFTLFSSMVWAFVLGPTIASVLLLFILFITTSFTYCKLVLVWIYEQVRFQSYRWTYAALFYLSAFTLWMSLCALVRVIFTELRQTNMDSLTDSDKILQRKKLELLQEEKTIKKFLNEDFDDGTLQNHLENYKNLINNLAENGVLSNKEIDEHRNNVSDFEFGVAKLIKNTKHKCCLAQNCIIINTNNCLLKSDSNAPKSFFGFQNVRASNSLFNIDGVFTGENINMTHSSDSSPKHKTGLDNVLFNNQIVKETNVYLEENYDKLLNEIKELLIELILILEIRAQRRKIRLKIIKLMIKIIQD